MGDPGSDLQPGLETDHGTGVLDFNFDREVARATAAALAPAPQAETKAPASSGAKT